MNTSSHNTKNIKNCVFSLSRDSTSHKAGSNRLKITRKANDLYHSDSSVMMTIQEAKALKTFLDKNLK